MYIIKMETSVPDCLVLKIEEYDNESKLLDTTLYVLYDTENNCYVVRGNRMITKDHLSHPYSFISDSASELADFISFVMCKKNLWTYVLYNYDNLPANSYEVTYDFLKHNESADYEMAAYDKQKYNKHRLIKNLRMVRNVFNYYN